MIEEIHLKNITKNQVSGSWGVFHMWSWIKTHVPLSYSELYSSNGSCSPIVWCLTEVFILNSWAWSQWCEADPQRSKLKDLTQCESAEQESEGVVKGVRCKGTYVSKYLLPTFRCFQTYRTIARIMLRTRDYPLSAFPGCRKSGAFSFRAYVFVSSSSHPHSHYYSYYYWAGDSACLTRS